MLYPSSSQKFKMIESRFQVEVFAIEPSPGFDFAIFNNGVFMIKHLSALIHRSGAFELNNFRGDLLKR